MKSDIMADQVLQYLSRSESQVVRKRKTVVIEQSLAEIVSRKGTITAADVVTEAADESHPLHEFFEWDDSEAARKFRLTQAVAMIIGTKYVCSLVERRGKGKTQKAIAGASSSVQVRRWLPAFSEAGFRERSDVLADEEARKSLVERKLSVLRGWCRSVTDIDELKAIREGLEAMLT
ncbi:MAG: hypothetical protein ABFE13_26405 [Phycisphaerales bacterium]